MSPGKYGKLWMYIVGAGLTVLSARYGGTTWMPYVVGAAGAAGVYGVPNSPNMLEAITGSITQYAPPFNNTLISPDNPVTALQTPEPSPDVVPMAPAPESP